jgi:hypothetical protein
MVCYNYLQWKDRVFWSKGKEGSFHPVGEDNYVIEVPLSIAEEKQVRKEVRNKLRI